MPHTPERNAAFEKYVLGQLRCARSRIKLLLNEIDVIGMGLRSGAISPDEAIYALHEAGTLNFLWPMPPPLIEEPTLTNEGNGHDGREGNSTTVRGASEVSSPEAGSTK
jgi:hypothetical protein